MAELNKFYLLFGTMYHHEPHPRWTNCDPAGWVLVEAPDELQARKLAHEQFGPHWSTLHEEAWFEVKDMQRHFPHGQVGHLIGDYATPDAPTPVFREVQDA